MTRDQWLLVVGIGAVAVFALWRAETVARYVGINSRLPAGQRKGAIV